MKKKLLFRLVPTAFIAMAFHTQTQIVASASMIFTDRTSFDAGTAGLQKTSNDFDSLVGTVFPDNYWAVGTGYQAESITVDNVLFVGGGSSQTWILGDDIPGGQFGMYVEGGAFDMDNIIDGNFVVAMGFTGSSEILFGSDVHAFGFDYRLDKWAGSYPLAGTLKATIYFEGGATTDHVMDTADGPRFLGFYSAASIERILFDTTVKWPSNPDRFPYLLVDNMTLGSVSAVPEPSSSVTFCAIASFAFSIVGRRRRRL